MPGLTDDKIEIVRMLVESAPDHVMGNLQKALASTGLESPLGGVRRLVEIEAADRRLRNAMLSPIAPLCIGDGRQAAKLVFPFRVLPLIWRGIKAESPGSVSEAAVLLADFKPDESSPAPFDALAERAAAGVRAGEQPDFRAAAELAEAAKPGGAELLAACLDIAPIVRAATLRLPEWIGRINDERAAAARCAYKDAVNVAEDAGPRFFEMLAAQLAQPWMVIHIISAVMDRPNERYLAGSELSVFAERLMAEIDDNLAAVAKLNVDGGPTAARSGARTVEIITQQITEMEQSIELNREGGWGARVAGQKRTLAATVEARMRDAEKAVAVSLPTHTVRIARMLKALPRLIAAPDVAQVNRAKTLLLFAEEVRASANHGGFASARSKMIESVAESLDNYVEDVLAAIREKDVEDPEIARAYLSVVADFNGLIRDQRAADVVRRRAAAA